MRLSAVKATRCPRGRTTAVAPPMGFVMLARTGACMTNVSTNAASVACVKAIWQFYGDGPLVSDWLAVTQEMVNQYCSAVWDSDWMHIDAERSRRDSPFGGTVAPGFWTLSMLPYLMRMAVGTDFPPDTVAGINYGFDRIRFPGPVLIGSRVRL